MNSGSSLIIAVVTKMSALLLLSVQQLAPTASVASPATAKPSSIRQHLLAFQTLLLHAVLQAKPALIHFHTDGLFATLVLAVRLATL